MDKAGSRKPPCAGAISLAVRPRNKGADRDRNADVDRDRKKQDL
jgi:hypothetical protein